MRMKTIDYKTVENEILRLLDKAADEDNAVGTTVYYSSVAITQGLVGILEALHVINENLLEMRREDLLVHKQN
jgi:hypothetical protein